MTNPQCAEVYELLYTSATTRVWRCGDASALDRTVCKQYLGARAVERLRTEKDILGRLASVEGVAQLAQAPDRPDLLVLRDRSGITLAQVLRGGKCSLTMLLALAIQLARTVAEVHRAGVIHRDINPDNIVVSQAGEPALIDFDLAVLAGEQLAVAPDGQIAGTLGYLAPEQTGRTGRVVDYRADLYALGATLYEMATGRPPFEGNDTLQLIHDHLVREPVAPSQVDPHVPTGLSNIILQLLSKAPEQRYQSADGLLHDLRRLRDDLERGQSGIFDLGERDFGARLVPPAGLVGRDAELTTLRNALTDARHTPRRSVLIEGPAGVGKSALVNELRNDMAALGGLFVRGKFDQYQQDEATAGAVTQALRSLGRLLLAQPAEQLAEQRRRILAALGVNAVLCTRLPEFALLLGALPEVSPVDPRQAELQLQLVTMDLLGAIASPQRPLVLVLEDLQWAGALSLRAFERMMNDPGLRGVLLVGVYRTGEVDAAPLLAPKLAEWFGQPEPPTRIALAPLTVPHTGELIGEMLRLSPEPSRALAEAVNALTGGNPFDTVETINSLRHDGVLRFCESGWHWDDVKVRRFVGRGNVVDLLAARISRLPTRSSELLESMACLGSAVECRLLQAAMGLSEDELSTRLLPALEDGLLIADTGSGTDSLRFRHDRVQQVVLGSMDETERTRRQLAMARRLAADPSFQPDAAQQYLRCVALLTDPTERRRSAQLFHNLAQTLSGTAAYLLAERYLSAAQAALASIDDPGDAALRRAIDAERHCALYSLGRAEESDSLYAAMQAHTAEPLDLVDPTCLQMRSLDMRNRSEDAMELGRHLLAQLGLSVPADYRDPNREERLDALAQWVMRDSKVDHSKRAQIVEPRLLCIARLLDQMMRSAYIHRDMNALSWLLLESQRLWAQHGPCAELVACLAQMITLTVLRQDYRTGFEVARHVLTVGEALGYEPQTSEARYSFATYACIWFEPLENALAHAARAYEGLRTNADLLAAFSSQVFNILLDVAPTIAVTDAEIEAGLVLCRRTGNSYLAALHTLERRWLRALTVQTKAPEGFDDEQFTEREFLAHTGQPFHVKVRISYLRALQALLWNDGAALARHTADMVSYLKVVPTAAYRMAHIHFFVALSRAWQVQQPGQSASRALPWLAELEFSRNWLAARAADQPHNFLHLLRLVEAEEAWALGDMWKALTIFDAAVVEAESRQRPWHRALITERAGLFHMARGLAGTGHHLLARACDQYRAWGAGAKVSQMHHDYPFLRGADHSVEARAGTTLTSVRASNGVSPDALDLMGVLRASQALSSETSLKQLAARVTEVLAALSGATKVLVLSWTDGHWRLLAPTPGEPSMSLVHAAEQGLLPLSAFGYAERTGEALVVDDAPGDDRFARDPYFAGVPLCSLLLLPIVGQGATRAMLLLENRQGRAAFNAQRLDAVMLIAGQLAVSMANAQLYESLEQRVQARTRELKETHAQLVSTARRAGMAEIANNVLHNVGNVLNSINVSARVMRGNAGKSRIEGLTRAVELMNEHKHDLAHFMEADPRGQALWPYMSDLVGALRTERDEILSDLERLCRNVDHATYVVATQQSHAGPSSVLEAVQPAELVEEALHLSEEAIKRCSVVVVRRHEDAGTATLDRHRLTQILVNLIANAVQAMERVPAPLRQLTLATAVLQDDTGERLCISVQDSGEGIAPENLERIFSHGFTTRQSGHGFGLHSSALAAMEMGGKLAVHSDGPGSGAVFTVQLPLGPPSILAGGGY